MRRHEFINEEIVQEIIQFIRAEKNREALLSHLDDYHDYDIAQALEELTPEERRELYEKMGTEWTAEIFSYYDEPETLMTELAPREAASVIEYMDSDDAAELLEQLPDSFQDKIEENLSEETSGDIKLISSYEDDEIGSLISNNYISICHTLTVKEAMKELIRQSADNDNITTLYAVDEHERFYGAIDLKDLILAREYTPLESIIVNSYPFVHDHDDLEECMDWIRDYEEDSLPVLDQDDRLIGIITVQDIVDYMEEESKEVYNKLAGIAEGDGSEDMKETLAVSMKKRLPWLIALLFLGMFVSSVVGMFEGIVSKVAILVCFQSLILDMAGNVGTQSLAVTIRVLMDEDITFKTRLALIWKEVKIGMANGGLLGIVSFLCIGVYVWLFKGNSILYGFAVSACVGISLLLAMAISSLAGTVIPLFFHKIKVDPAVASGPLITTVNDLVAVITYYGMAWLMLFHLFHLA